MYKLFLIYKFQIKNGCPTTLGQFDSTMSKSFRGVETRICPAKLVSNGKEEMKKNLYQKLKEINQKFIESRVSTVRIGG